MEESARVRREAQEAKTQAGEDKQEAEQDSSKMAVEGVEGDDLQDKEPREDPGSQGNPWFITSHVFQLPYLKKLSLLLYFYVIFISVFILNSTYMSLDTVVYYIECFLLL